MTTTSTPSPTRDSDPVAAFLAQYSQRQTRQQLKKLVNHTILECEKLLKNKPSKEECEKLLGKRPSKEKYEELLASRRIKGVVSGRIKKYSSLKKKLEGEVEAEIHDLIRNPEEGKEKSVKDAENETSVPGVDTHRDLLGNSENDLIEYFDTDSDEDLDEEYSTSDNHEESYSEDLDSDTDSDLDPGLKEVPKLRDWISSGKNIYKHPEMGDLAGVRIGLYFPNDIVKVAKRIKDHFDEKWCFGTVTGGRNIDTARNQDIVEHLNGRWYSAAPDGTPEHWEHPGYKSWQVVVQWKAPLPPKLHSLKSKLPKSLRSLRVEIQVGTIVTQAWAEIQHDIIYKRPADILATPSMRRMIDATNGLAINTDIVLTELERSLEQAKKEAKARLHQCFTDGAEFWAWFQKTYLSKLPLDERQRWIYDQGDLDKLISKWAWYWEVYDPQDSTTDPYYPKPSRAGLKELIDENNVIESHTGISGELHIAHMLTEEGERKALHNMIWNPRALWRVQSKGDWALLEELARLRSRDQ